MKHYPEVDSSPSFPSIEEQILKFWQEQDLFNKSIENRSKDNEFIFYDGPPFANGLPHYGHLLSGYVKDVVARYQTTKGKRVERRFGWDCHGLPAEMGAEKELNISGRLQIMQYGVDKFNQHCRSSVLKYVDEWKNYVNRQARWVDFKNDYKTMDTNFMESVLWAFKQLYDKGLIYESLRVMPYSWACETPLSNFETRLDNSYRERSDKAVTVFFTLNDKPNNLPSGYSSYKILAWTTTPWTLPSNLALAIGAELEYVAVSKNGECLIIAESSLGKYNKELLENEEVNIIAKFKGKDLVGLTYKPLLPYFKDHPNAFRVLAGDFVTEGDGTGVVHIAPGFGEDDQLLCNNHNIELVCPVDGQGKFTSEVTDFVGKQVFDTIDDIIKLLKNNGSWLKTEQFIHNYPHCWRTDTPLIYKAVPSWYVKVTAFKDRMVELNQQINWTPNHIKDGLFGKWLENARDWSISRNRFWGTPIPVWRSDNPAYPRIDVYGSIEELERDFNVKITDLHKPLVDDLVRANPDDPSGKSMMRRVEDVFDCWFESGSMPYGQAHYPFENQENFKRNFPADFIVEYTAQTRGWFYTLMVLSTALFDQPPFKNCICHGVILDENGQKLSKRLNNYADPMDIFDKFGSDALRFFMISSSAMRGQELLIDKEGKMVRDVIRLSIKPIWNAYNFFTLYANADGIKASYQTTSDNLLDQYILAKVKEAVNTISYGMDNYDLPTACNAVHSFFEVLTNWYIRRNRPRFWKTEHDSDKQSAYNTLYTVLHIMCRASSSLMPFITESIYLGLEAGGQFVAEKSVHLADFPDVSLISYQGQLVANMDRIRDICSSVLAIRNNENIKTRIPLAMLRVVGKNVTHLDAFKELIKDEVNVKEVEFTGEIGDLASLKLQLNFANLGKRLPTKMKELIGKLKAGQWNILENNQVEIAGEVLNSDEFDLSLIPHDPKSSQTLSSNDALVILDLNITEELRLEGLARDLVRFIQQSRKDTNLNVSDRINLMVEASDEIYKAIDLFALYISEQTLAKLSKKTDNSEQFTYVKEAELDNENVKISFSVLG